MLAPHEILEKALEFAEQEYLAAKARGVPSPVIELNATDADDPEEIEVVVWRRQYLVESLRMRGVADEGVARNPDCPEGAGTFSVLVVAEEGIFPFKMPIPYPLGAMQAPPAEG
jgi:hypothetical protein